MPCSAWFLLVPAVVAASPAERAEVQACIKASTRGQELRDRSRLIDARAQFRLCAVDACPRPLRADCTQWAADAEKAVPSLVLAVREGNSDVTGVSLTLDGAPVALDGRPLEVDPGPHRLVARKEEASSELSVVALAGEKNRPIVVPWQTAAPAGPLATPEPTAPTVPPPALVVLAPPVARPSPPGRSLTGPVALGLLGVAGLGVFAGVGAWGRSELDGEVSSPCGLAHNCPPGTTDGVREKYLVADVGLGVGVAAMAAGVAWYLIGASDSQLTVAPARGGAVVCGSVRW